MPDEIDRKLIDKRVAHRYLRKGRLDEKTYQGMLEALPDLAEQAVPLSLASEPDLDEDDFDDDEEEEDDEGEASLAAPGAANDRSPELTVSPDAPPAPAAADPTDPGTAAAVPAPGEPNPGA